jgi:hypothetical protein
MTRKTFCSVNCDTRVYGQEYFKAFNNNVPSYQLEELGPFAFCAVRIQNYDGPAFQADKVFCSRILFLACLLFLIWSRKSLSKLLSVGSLKSVAASSTTLPYWFL